MASNHTEATAITDVIISEFFWEKGYKDVAQGVTKKAFLAMAERGDFQISSLMENLVTHVNPKMKRSNLKGEDHIGGSEDKYMSTRVAITKTKYTLKDGTVRFSESKRLNCALSPKSLKNKKGTLRIAITVYNSLTWDNDVLLIRIPYPDWQQCTIGNGYLVFDFYMDGTLKPTPMERFGKWICKDIKEFCK